MQRVYFDSTQMLLSSEFCTLSLCLFPDWVILLIWFGNSEFAAQYLTVLYRDLTVNRFPLQAEGNYFKGPFKEWRASIDKFLKAFMSRWFKFQFWKFLQVSLALDLYISSNSVIFLSASLTGEMWPRPLCRVQGRNCIKEHLK